jgi:putative SOS response-associated peptidase YedK
MCTRYVSPEAAAIERHWHIGRGQPFRGPRSEKFPKYTGPFLRAAAGERAIELVVGQWWLIADRATERSPAAKTYNARWEALTSRWSFRGPWQRGQRCIIPAECWYEPNWELGRHVPWCFRTTDGSPWGLAGLWNDWVDPSTGEAHGSYTMLTMNADSHPLMRRMHTPDPRLPPEAQDKRSVVPIGVADVNTWLFGTIDDAAGLMRLPPAALFDAGPDLPPETKGSLL